MTKYTQRKGIKGSLLAIQNLVNECPWLLNKVIEEKAPHLKGITWVSPLKDEGYAEYRDEAFLDQIGLSDVTLESFWPRRGPQWDALAVTGSGDIILLEAKAHILETVSSGMQALSPSSKELIRKSLLWTKTELGALEEADWTGAYYQYANRLAHLTYLSEKMNRKVYLVNLYVFGDSSVKGPEDQIEWEGQINEIKRSLGLPQHHKLSDKCIDVFIHSKNIATASIELPRLFTYASSELSQDAFLCWLIAWAGIDGHPMQCLGTNFIGFLFDLAYGDGAAYGIELVGEPFKQFQNIDVYFQAKVNGRLISFIIEDKTATFEHDNQLEVYKSRIQYDSTEEAEILTFYMKTGYHFEADRKLGEKGHVIIDGAQFLQFLENQREITNDILCDYRMNLKTQLDKRQTITDSFWKNEDISLFQHDHIQFEYMSALAKACPEFIYMARIDNERNLDGSPFCCYNFAYIPNLYGENCGEHLFYRLGKKMNPATKINQPFLSLRQHAFIKTLNSEKANQLKRERLVFLRNIFSLMDISGLKQSPFTNRGLNESEITCFFIDNEVNTPKRILDLLPKVHAEYVRKISDLYLK